MFVYRAVATSGSSNSAAAATGDARRYPHDAPERDFGKFPAYKQPVEAGKLRIGFVPDEWFKAMYEKTGVMGPYITFWGGLAALLSKEIYVVWADSWEHLTFLALVVGATKLYGKQIGQFLDKQADAYNHEYKSALDEKTKHVDESIQANLALQSLPEANKLVNAAKKVIIIYALLFDILFKF